MEEQLQALIERHCVTIRKYVDTIGCHLSRIGEPDLPEAEALTEAENLAHQLKGSSGTIGFHEVSAAATALDDYLKLLCVSNEAITEKMLAKLLDLYGDLKNIAEKISPESSTLYPTAVSLGALRNTKNTGSSPS